MSSANDLRKRPQQTSYRPRVSRGVFLDFDGVLHPAGGEPGQELPFCWLSHLVEVLSPFPTVSIVIHSSWVQRFSLEDMREFLGPLGTRVLGAVGPGSKAQAVRSFASAHPEIRRWLVIDDHADEFVGGFPWPVLSCQSSKGLSDPRAKECLRQWLLD